MSAAHVIAREQAARIARLNDLARKAMGIACTAVATVGFRSLPEADQSQVRELIETYDAFDEDNDPHGERDLSDLVLWDAELLWKIDYYDKGLQFNSDDPANAQVTKRVLTVMLGGEW